MRWTTLLQWIDIETGEVLTADDAYQNYYTIKKQIKNEHANTHQIIRRIIYECRRKPTQTKLF